MFDEPATPVTIALRIPGKWSEPKELVQQLPEGVRVTGEELVMPDGERIDFGALPPDHQFAEIFRSSCRNMPTDEETAALDAYQVNLTLSGPGGSLESARTMMNAAAALIRAGGAGVFIDNSGVAHGGRQWLQLTEDGVPDALSFAFIAIVGSDAEIYTVGLHVLGQREIVMKRADVERGFDIIDVIRYLCDSDKPVDDGHVIADLEGPRFQVVTQDASSELPVGSPFHNPFGRLKLVSFKDIAEKN